MHKIIKTELGDEKQCPCCEEFYPIHQDFFYQDGKDSKGIQKFKSYCIACYTEKYKNKCRNKSC